MCFLMYKFKMSILLESCCVNFEHNNNVKILNSGKYKYIYNHFIERKTMETLQYY